MKLWQQSQIGNLRLMQLPWLGYLLKSLEKKLGGTFPNKIGRKAAALGIVSPYLRTPQCGFCCRVLS